MPLFTPTTKFSYWLFNGPPRPPFTPSVMRKAHKNIEKSRHVLEECMARGGDVSEVADNLSALGPELDRILEALTLIRSLQEANVSADFWWHFAIWGRCMLGFTILVMSGWGWKLEKCIPIGSVLINSKYLFPTNDGLVYMSTQVKTLGRGFFFEHFLNTCLLLIYCMTKGPMVVGLTTAYCFFFLVGCRASKIRFVNLWKVTLPEESKKVEPNESIKEE